MPHRISRKFLPRLSKLTLDYLYDPDRTGAFFSYPHDTPAAYQAVARRMENRPCAATPMAEVLHRQNREFGAGSSTVERAKLLADKNALCVFTGQQAGLFGGPLYVCHKAITAICRARDLEKLLRRPVLPVFWIAADDHDFAEVQSAGFPGQHEGRSVVQRVAYDPAELADRTPISQVVLDDSINATLSAFRKANVATEFGDEVYVALADAYRPGRSMVEAFARWMTRLYSHLGLLVFNPADPEAKRLLAPMLRCELCDPSRSDMALDDIEARLTEAGYHHQVSRAPHHTTLFYHDRGRHAIKRDGDRLWIDPEGEPLPTSDWGARLEQSPERFSPGVLLRPVVQSYWFPVIAAVLGPSEIAYWAQSRALFDRFEVCMPVVVPRAGATILEPKTRHALQQLGLGPHEFFEDIEAVINRHFEHSFPADLSARFDMESEESVRRLGDVQRLVTEFEPTLARTFELAANKMRGEWKSLAKKTFQAHKRRGEQVRAKLYKLATNIYPENQPQERIFSIVYFLNKYGFGLIDTLHDKLCPETHDHQLIDPLETLAPAVDTSTETPQLS